MGNYNNNILGQQYRRTTFILKGLGVKTLFSFGYTKKNNLFQ